MKYVSVRELKNQTSSVLRLAVEEDVIITSHGKPVALLQEMAHEDLEDYVFYSAGPVRRRIERRWDQYRRSGKTIPLDELKGKRRKKRG